jgi:hypothetical protein
MSSTIRILTMAVAAVAGPLGCTVHATTEPVGYTEVTSSPADAYYYSYPNTEYEGHPVYYVEGRWIYRDRDRWRAYREEPAPLYRYRTTVQQAPPAPRYPNYGPPPARQYGPPQPAPETAPPATRVR